MGTLWRSRLQLRSGIILSLCLTSCQSSYKLFSSRRQAASTSCALHSSGKNQPTAPTWPRSHLSYRWSRRGTDPCYCRSTDGVTDPVTNLAEKVRKKQGRGSETIIRAEKWTHLQFLVIGATITWNRWKTCSCATPPPCSCTSYIRINTSRVSL